MLTQVEKAREFARSIEMGSLWLDADKAMELAQLLESLAEAAENQAAKLNSVEFALQYYSQPHLYIDSAPRSPTEPILDGGLRARTALGMLKMRPRPTAATRL
jgi:hypothetical protein